MNYENNSKDHQKLTEKQAKNRELHQSWYRYLQRDKRLEPLMMSWIVVSSDGIYFKYLSAAPDLYTHVFRSFGSGDMQSAIEDYYKEWENGGWAKAARYRVSPSIPEEADRGASDGLQSPEIKNGYSDTQGDEEGLVRALNGPREDWKLQPGDEGYDELPF